ncbi:suppressor of cytokine signaling 5 [Ceratina calcarata]|uniref:Suppressor of cytokine signaling 5 n=1 Tax=Ceratina calcarata TaxID=156304 RepID=A0AAJ7NAM9_9HYME|nr:suppressor of cytokine signaling 5 [Ceratina calcarata]
MISQTSEEVITSAATSATRTSNQDTKSRKLNANALNLFWWRDSQREKKEDLVEVTIVKRKTRDAFSNRMSDFFKNIKKHVRIRKRKSQQRREVETPSLQNDANSDLLTSQNNGLTASLEENNVSDLRNEDPARNTSVQSSNETLTATEISENQNETAQSYSDIENKLEVVDAQITDNDIKINFDNVSDLSQSCSNDKRQQSERTVEDNATESQIERFEENTDANTSNENKVKASLTKELLKLSNYGWYWGPISGTEADAKLISEPDGAFLVRDSSDDRYVLTLSFKSSGKLLHTRMEHSGGLFSLCNQSDGEAFSSVADLIDYSINFSQTAVFCYAQPRYPGYPSFPVRLTKPVSRFTQVRSLQYLCRFVIRQNTRLDNIHKLPLPKTIKGYIEEAYY